MNNGVVTHGSGIVLPGSLKNTKPLKECSRCGNEAEQASGVQVSATRWHCYKCWRLKK